IVALIGTSVINDNGASAFTIPPINPPGSVNVYVSSRSIGDDQNDGLTRETPFRTITKALSLNEVNGEKVDFLIVNIMGPEYELIAPDVNSGNGVLLADGVTGLVFKSDSSTANTGKVRVFTRVSNKQFRVTVSQQGIDNSMLVDGLFFDNLSTIWRVDGATGDLVQFNNNRVVMGDSYIHGVSKGRLEGNAVVLNSRIAKAQRNEVVLPTSSGPGSIRGISVSAQEVDINNNKIVYG